ncbi:MAG: SO2930 family diheme c-type cytochrome [Pseudomonadota bacterium]
MRIVFSVLALFVMAPALSACFGGAKAPITTPTFFAEDNPAQISDWGLMDVSDGELVLSQGVVPYDLNSALFTDYALKLRTIWVPEDSGSAAFRANDYPDFPVGTVISKTFYYPRGQGAQDVLKIKDTIGETNPILHELGGVLLLETRLLVRRSAGWEAVSYVWNEAQSDARLTKIGDAQPLSLIRADGETEDFTYIVPDINQCAGCHATNNTTREIVPLGVRPRHVNKTYRHDEREVNQLEHLDALGDLQGTDDIKSMKANVDWTDQEQSLSARARSYLDINCSHCHNPVGPADTSGLDLSMEAMTGPELGVCKLPIAAGAGTGGRAFSIVPGDPDASILLHRVETTNPGAMMPELGRALQHREGAELLREWIAEMEGSCST